MTDKQTKLARVIVIVLLLGYYTWILTSAWAMSDLWYWNIEEGLIWIRGGVGFIPFPFRTETGIAIPSRAHPIIETFYLVFMHNGIWIAWIIFGLSYLLYLLRSYRVVSSPQ